MEPLLLLLLLPITSTRPLLYTGQRHVLIHHAPGHTHTIGVHITLSMHRKVQTKVVYLIDTPVLKLVARSWYILRHLYYPWQASTALIKLYRTDTSSKLSEAVILHQRSHEIGVPF